MTAIKTILCPTDLSPISLRALEYAAALSGASGARLQVLEVADPALSSRLRRTALDELEAAVDPVRSATLNVDVALASGFAKDEILRAATARRADLIVMGTHGRSGFERFMLGSVTEFVLRKARCPVLAIPPAARHPRRRRAGGPGLFQTVVCAVDFAPASMRAIAYAQSFAAEGGRLILVHAITWPFGEGTETMPPEIDALRHSLERDATDRLRRAAASHRSDLSVKDVVTAGKSHADVLRVARDESADLIVMGLHSHATGALTLLGSTTRRVLHEAPCPVLTVGAARMKRA